MTNVPRRIMNALLVLMLMLPGSNPQALPAVSEWSRLRVTDSRTADLLRRGINESPLLREMVARVEAGEVMVYLFADDTVPGRQTGRMNFLGEAGAHRYVRVSIRRSLPPHQFIAALAHEIQHVHEIIAHPEVRDAASLLALYRRIGNERQARGRSSWETDAARKVSHDVQRELLVRR
jgi:hypothetical protein